MKKPEDVCEVDPKSAIETAGIESPVHERIVTLHHHETFAFEAMHPVSVSPGSIATDSSQEPNTRPAIRRLELWSRKTRAPACRRRAESLPAGLECHPAPSAPRGS